MRNLKPLLAATLLVSSAPALAVDTPHDGSVSSSVTECLSCHQLHSGGGTLTKYSSNNDSCLTCHDSIVPGAYANHFFSPAWAGPGREAAPGTTGDQHKWSGSPTARGARIPLNADMAPYLTGGSLQCAACHDAHGKKDAFGASIQDTLAPDSSHASVKFNLAMPPNGGGAGRMKLIRIDDGGYPPRPGAFAIRIKPGGTTLEVSHDYRTAATPTWVSTIPFTVGADVGLDDPSVVVRFTVAPAEGNIWEFYVGYPLLRATNVADAMCVDCHADRVMDHTCVEGVGAGCTPGTKVYSHPVNQGLNANAKSYDLAAPLDADGTPANGSTTDGEGGVANPGNDLRLSSGMVRCTTCHAPHNSDSNSLTVDVR
jgi:cytochrome c553